MTTVSQASLFFSSLLGSGALGSGSQGMPFRRNARASPSRFLRDGAVAVTDMAPRICGGSLTRSCQSLPRLYPFAQLTSRHQLCYLANQEAKGSTCLRN